MSRGKDLFRGEHPVGSWRFGTSTGSGGTTNSFGNNSSFNRVDTNVRQAQGWVGERPDGLAGVVSASAPAEARSAVERVNAERMVEYNRIAAQQKTSVAAVQAIVGKKLIDQAAKGTYIMNAQGQWVKK